MAKVQKSAPQLVPTKVTNSNRHFYTEALDTFPFPDLIEVQTKSFEWFLRDGIPELLEEINPIEDPTGKKLRLEIKSYEVEDPKHDLPYCRRKGLSYEASIRAHVSLTNLETGEIKEQDVYFGQIPLITEDGTFVVNGIDRIIVSQIVRSPGIFFFKNQDTESYDAKMIPRRGAWIEIETDKRGLVWAKVDRKRKIPVTMFLRAFGFDTNEKILELFKDTLKGVPDESNPILKTLDKDEALTEQEAWQGVYKRIRPGDLATPDNARAYIMDLFQNFRKYDLGPIARYKINEKFDLDVKADKEGSVFRIEDFVLMVNQILKNNLSEDKLANYSDDIDHLANRRIRGVGELVQNKFRIGLLRTERIVRDRMSIIEMENVTPTQLVNCRPITASMHEFFASAQLSQFMDQTNPLAALEHKRRISAMGPGGLSRERASFEVRDVHPSHYGRICPVTTPEGPNIGLVLHLAAYAKVNAMGFIETPYRTVKSTVKNDGESAVGRKAGATVDKIVKEDEVITKEQAEKLAKVKDLKEVKVRPYITEEVSYYGAAQEEKGMCIAQANSILNEKGEFVHNNVAARQCFEPGAYPVGNVTHIDISPKQIVSLSTSMIAFLEHDDNTRALMGSNMQRQAVPLVKPQSPVVGTGMEAVTSYASCVVAPEDGEVKSADGEKVTFVGNSGKKHVYKVRSYFRTNQSSCLHQRTLAVAGTKVKKGDVLIDGACAENGEMALGQNLRVAYMSWNGLNYEDAIIVSDRIVKDGVFNSIHIEKYELDVRDTKLGPEELTADIPNVGQARLKNLDEMGIIRVGTTALAGDILAGKVTPKGETELTAEDRLLRAIFGEKAHDVKDSSLKLPRGSGGKVIHVEILDRSEGDDLATGVLRKIVIYVAQMRHLEAGDKMAGRHGNKGVISKIIPVEDMPFAEDGQPVDIILNPLGVSSRMNIGQVLETHLGIAAENMDIKVATPVLSGIKMDKIQDFLVENEMSPDGKIQLYDGQTGDAFDHKTVVGIVYMLKLIHLVEDKIHARSVGPYSLVTQQPFGGKAQNGGQRFGEMEVWALEAYGAAHILQEMLTIKSDDVHGRSKAYESIVKSQPINLVSIPESFNVLMKELQALGLRVDLLNHNEIAGEVVPDLEATDEALIADAGGVTVNDAPKAPETPAEEKESA